MVFLERARVAAELAERAWHPADPLPGRSGVAATCELYRQSVHWALLAHRGLGPDGSEPTTTPTLAELWGETDPTLLTRAAGGDERLARLRSELVERSFVEFADLPEKKQEETARAARDFLRSLLETLEPERRKAERIWFRRALFVACGLLGLILAVLAVRAIVAAREARKDLAAGAGWTTSSVYVVGCSSPRQDCAESPHYFFHTTQENDPWIVFDLGQVRKTSSIVVTNRLDCCPDRAVPLVVELSTDNKNWKVVAKRTKSFDTFRATYATTRARYVKLHVPRPDGILHFKSVRVLP